MLLLKVLADDLNNNSYSNNQGRFINNFMKNKKIKIYS